MRQPILSLVLVGLCAPALLIDSAWASPSDDDTHFETHIRPILVKHCYGCHGPEKQKSSLRLDSAEALSVGGSRGPAVIPNDSNSLLLEAIRQTGELKMPPDGPLDPEVIERLSQWIQEGAHWPAYDPSTAPEKKDFSEARARHWAYQPLKDTAPPTHAEAPHPIDAYIRSAQEAAGLTPSPMADKRTLLRRVTYDLTGLPPTPEALAAFEADQSPEAWQTVIDGLLASPFYGERWGRHWLDVVRYTDSFDSRGNDKTDPVEIWRYRDWVVHALNEDMPYTDFVTHQVAGDLLPAPSGDFYRDGLIATGMLAIGHWPQGDADKQKMVSDIVDDQVDVVTRAFLGTTLACARCHDHKFDPLSIEEYYGMAGIFFSSSILPGPGAKTEGSPISHFPLAAPEAVARRAEAEGRIKTLIESRDTQLEAARDSFATAELGKTGAYLLATRDDATADTSPLHPDVLQRWQRTLDGDVRPALPKVQERFQSLPGVTTRKGNTDTPSAVGNASEHDIAYATIAQTARSVAIHPGPTEGVGLAWRAPTDATITLQGHLADADSNCGDGVQWTLTHHESGLGRTIASGRVPNGERASFAIDTPFAVAAQDQLRLTVLPAGGHACDTTELRLTITPEGGPTWDSTETLLTNFAQGNPWPDVQRNPEVWWLFTEQGGSTLDPILFAPWRAALREVASGQRDEVALAEAAAAIQAAIDGALANPESPLKRAVSALREPGGPAWSDTPPPADPDAFNALVAELSELEKEVATPFERAVGIQEGGVPNTEHAGIHDVHVHRRGEYTNLGDLVPRHMPALITGSAVRPVTEGSGRRELAQWLTEDSAPLLARVMVNRVWQHHFGAGLVRTPGDFGAQGQAPTHPELLDYLAARFIESGWSLKALHRLILTSATWQQRSGADKALHTADPENRLLARMNRQRLDAESLRDSLLFVTDQLDPTPGGPAYVDLATPRRTLYYRTSRSNLNTYTQLFDGADPTSIVAARNESTVAPQALFLMNHPLQLRAAEALATIAATDPSTAAVDTMYHRLFLRPPTDAERDIAEHALQQLGHPENTTALAAYAQVLLSSNAFYFVD